jgi:hypothetical protein
VQVLHEPRAQREDVSFAVGLLAEHHDAGVADGAPERLEVAEVRVRGIERPDGGGVAVQPDAQGCIGVGGGVLGRRVRGASCEEKQQKSSGRMASDSRHGWSGSYRFQHELIDGRIRRLNCRGWRHGVVCAGLGAAGLPLPAH